MVQGLGFLSKKSWHTKNIANQEKVWMAEQKKHAEAAKTKELAKQIQQEREQEELDRIAGKKTTMDRGIDWMYQGAKVDSEIAKEDAAKKAEEFLLGKEFTGEGATSGDFDNGDQHEGIHNVISHTAEATQPPSAEEEFKPAYSEPTVKDRNENFQMRVEDPMFLVSQQQRAKEVKHEQTKALYERVIGYEEGDDDRPKNADRKRSRKDRKKHKRKRSRRSDNDGDRQRRRRRSRSRSRSNDRRRKHRRRNRSQSRSYSRSRSRSESKDSREQHQDRRHHRRHREERLSRGRDDDNRRRGSSDRHYRSDSEDLHRPRRDDRGRRRRSPEEGSRKDRDYHSRRGDKRQAETEEPRKSDPPEQQPDNPRTKEGYGLKGSKMSALDRSQLGPDQDLLQKKREEREAERKRIRGVASSRRRTTQEERAKALQEMQTDARTREEKMIQQAAKCPAYNQDDDAPEKGSATFLSDITKQTHGVGQQAASLSSRVAQNRHTNQRLHDSFL